MQQNAHPVKLWLYGGTCVSRGCVPKILLVYASHFHEDFQDAAGFGREIEETRFDWTGLMSNHGSERR